MKILYLSTVIILGLMLTLSSSPDELLFVWPKLLEWPLILYRSLGTENKFSRHMHIYQAGSELMVKQLKLQSQNWKQMLNSYNRGLWWRLLVLIQYKDTDFSPRWSRYRYTLDKNQQCGPGRRSLWPKSWCQKRKMQYFSVHNCSWPFWATNRTEPDLIMKTWLGNSWCQVEHNY